MEKSTFYSNRLLIFASILSLLLGASCSSSKISQINQPAAPYLTVENNEQLQPVSIATEQSAPGAMPEEQLLASTSTNAHNVAAAATRPASGTNTFLSSSREINEAAVQAETQASTLNSKSNKAALGKQNITKSLSFPAKVMLKSIAKKAQKLEKKQGEDKARKVNNSRYLIAGIILAVVGLVLVIAGNTTLLYILGAVAALAGLVLLLLALL